MKTYNVKPVTAKKPADSKEWAIAEFYGIARSAHDSKAYNTNSDVETGNKNISVKSDGFTLMSANFTKGATDFDEIWTYYRKTVHSDTFAYVTNDYTVYEMNIDEFEMFVYAFCGLQAESQKNGGGLKIRCKHESKKMIQWLDKRTGVA